MLVIIIIVIQIHSFIGMGSDYHWLIKEFIAIASDIAHITQKKIPFIGDDKCD